MVGRIEKGNKQGGWGWAGVLLAFNEQKPEMLQNFLICTGQAPTTKKYLAQNANSAAVEKPCTR